MNRTFLLMALLVSPTIAFGAGFNIGQLKQSILNATSIEDAYNKLKDAKGTVDDSDKYKDAVKDDKKTKAGKLLEAALEKATADADPSDTRTDEEKEQALAEKKQAYEDAKANEQSTANKTLTAVTTAAMGIGGMELAQGLAEKKADADADSSMDAYIATMHCTYGDGKQVKAGPEGVELPGGNDMKLMQYRNEYFALAKDLKERKTALKMKPGIESEEIIDKAETGLYDDESIGIEGGAYASRYRAKMLGSEKDQEKLDADKKTTKNRIMGGAIAAGAGAVIGIAGNSLINGKLGELIKKKMNKDESSSENEAAIKSLKDGLDQTGMQNVDKLDLSAFDISELQEYIDGTDFSLYDLSNYDATEAIDTTDSSTIENSLKTLLSDDHKRQTE